VRSRLRDRESHRAGSDSGGRAASRTRPGAAWGEQPAAGQTGYLDADKAREFARKGYVEIV